MAVLPQTKTQFFDVEAKTWKPLASTTPAIEAADCYCAAAASNDLYVAGFGEGGYYIYRDDKEGNVWEKQPLPCGEIDNLCFVYDYMYAVSFDCNQFPQRCSFAKCHWQTFAKVGSHPYQFYNSGATVVNSKVYVLYGLKSNSSGSWCMQNARLRCFDPVKNKWEQKAITRRPHFGFILFVVNSRLFVARGCDSIARNGTLQVDPASVKVYDEEKNTWSVVKQNKIPPANPNAVEIEGKVYFIINKFPVDSGIRIPPEELYPVHLGEWDNVGKIATTAALCYLPEGEFEIRVRLIVLLSSTLCIKNLTIFL